MKKENLVSSPSSLSPRIEGGRAELKLWKVLRAKQLEGLKFRRQEPIGPFIVDFACFEKRLVIEADGSEHFRGNQKVRDLERDGWLKDRGCRVMRFGNSDILTNMDGVLRNILELTQDKSATDSSAPTGEDEGEGELDD